MTDEKYIPTDITLFLDKNAGPAFKVECKKCHENICLEMTNLRSTKCSCGYTFSDLNLEHEKRND